MAVATALLLGCGGPDNEGICKDAVSCAGGNDKDVQACIAQAEYVEKQADIRGCDSEYSDYIDCVQTHAKCQSTPTGQGCGSDSDCSGLGGGGARCVDNQCEVKAWGVEDPKTCEAEKNAYDRCE